MSGLPIIAHFHCNATHSLRSHSYWIWCAADFKGGRSSGKPVTYWIIDLMPEWGLIYLGWREEEGRWGGNRGQSATSWSVPVEAAELEKEEEEEGGMWNNGGTSLSILVLVSRCPAGSNSSWNAAICAPPSTPQNKWFTNNNNNNNAGSTEEK